MKRIIVEIISIMFILLFVYAGVTKLLDYNKFNVQLGQSPLLAPFADSVAWFIPSLELMIALMLIFNKFRLTALYISFALMLLFTIYIVFIMNFAEHVPCSCGGILENMGWSEHLAFNVGFVLLSITAILLSSQEATRKQAYSVQNQSPSIVK